MGSTDDPGVLARQSTRESDLSAFLRVRGVMDGPAALTVRGHTGAGWRAELRIGPVDEIIVGAGETPDEAISEALRRCGVPDA